MSLTKSLAVPPPEPKKFTDEELKKYGIHMASRLNEDDAQGQNKWADIDDDDDDWAPEAITWGDGTKTTLPHPDEHPVPLPPPPAPLSDNGSVASKGKGFEKPRSPAPPLMGSPLTKSTNLASGKGMILKSGLQEKPTLVAKPPAPPAPVKSPWATLPPVEKSSPNLAEAHLARPNYGQPSPLKRMTPPPRDYPHDDFNRSAWRDGGAHGPRELYNAHSGRYEPAPERRPSMRMEQHPKPPSVLQRPSQSDYPEPSSAFQTSRVTQEAPFGRRRGSSNVSGGSGQYYHRMGKDGPNPPMDHLGPRRPSFAGSVESPVSPNLSVQHPHPGWMPRSSPRAAFATPHASGPPPYAAGPPPHASGPPPPPPEAVMGPPPPPPPAQPLVDEVEFQKKLMRERIELARKRRQDEEAHEEAARRERIQKKLEAMGPAPEKKSDKKESPQVESAKPVHIQQREPGTESTEGSSPPEQEGGNAPIPAHEEPSKQDGKPSSPKKSPPSQPGQRRTSQSQEQKPVGLWGAASATRQERFSTWGAAAAQQASRNVWGSPNNDRGLGNGTFNTDLGRPGTDNVAAAAPGGKGPSPIAPPTSTAQSPSQGRPHPPAPIGLRGSRYAGPGTDLASKWVAAVHDNDKKMGANRLAERAEREHQLAERGLTLEDAQPIIKETWRQVNAPGDGTRRSAGTSETQAHQPPHWKSQAEELPQGISQEDLPSAPHAGVIGPSGGSILSQAGKGAPAQGRGSRFFPTRDIRLDETLPSDPARSKSPTPPPPTMEGHPAYEGDVMHPQVSLPKPHPIVKLPPTMDGSQPPQARPQFGWANPTPYKDPRAPLSNRRPSRSGEASQEKWQSRINSLLNGGQKSPPQKSIGVDPASKSALDHPTHLDSATVSLPGTVSPRVPVPVNHSLPTTKPMAEDCFEEQEMGSLPQIRFPHKAPDAAWQPALAPVKTFHRKFLVQPAVRESYSFVPEVVGGGNAMRIQFPGMEEPKIVTVPFSATRGGRGSHGRPGPRHRGSGFERRGGKRDVSSTRGEHDASSSSSGTRGRGRGGYRGRGSDNWSRHSGTPPSLPA